MGVAVSKCGGEFFIDDETLHRSALCILDDVTKLYRWKGHSVGNLTIPEVTGELARRMKANGADHTINMVLVGDVLYDDTLPSDPDEGFEQNLDWFTATFLDLPATANHTRDGKVITASGSVRTNPVQVYDFQQGDTGRGVDQFGNFTVGCLATLYIRIPKGKLEL